MGKGRGTKTLLALAATVGAALVAASTAAAAPTYSTQYGNNTSLDCLQAPRWSGVLTATSVIKRQHIDRNKTGVQIDLDYDLTISFQPSNPAQPSYTGTQRISLDNLALPLFAPSYDVPMSMALQGSNGSSATMYGGQMLVLTWKPDKNVQISISDDGWNCSA
jgi:hypothetical protein